MSRLHFRKASLTTYNSMFSSSFTFCLQVYDAVSYLPTCFLCVLVCFLFQISEFVDTAFSRISALVLLFLLYGWSRFVWR